MPPNRNEVAAKVLEIVAETLAISTSDITEQTLLIEDLNTDSMDIVTLAVLFDDTFKVDLNLEDLPPERVSLAWVIDYITARLA